MVRRTSPQGVLYGAPQVRLRIGVVDYLNAYPLWAALEEPAFAGTVQLVRGVPSFLAGELLAGRVDAALISSVEYLRHREGLSFHPGLCISAAREVKSIRLFVQTVRQPFAEQLKNIRRIYTDISSRSSVAQLQVMLRELNLAPELEEISGAGERIAQLKEDEALLSIGDTALSHRNEPSYDLQREYFGLFAHGFVYALWVFRTDLGASIVPLLSNAYDVYKADLPRFLQLATERFDFPAEFTRPYLTEIIHHELSAERKDDLDFFAAKLKI
jgi:chorismate dehydratase